MDKRLEDKMDLKIVESMESYSEIKLLADSLESMASETKSFSYGILVGRLYNSFYYQSRRILGRNPTPGEFAEFVGLVQTRESEILQKLEGRTVTEE